MANYKEFSRQIKEKYPQYKDVDDEKLAKAMIEKYPQYKEKVTFNIENTPIRPKNNFAGDFVQGFTHGLTSLPTALGNSIGNNLRPLIGKEKLTQEQIKEINSQAPLFSYTTRKPEGISGNIGNFTGELLPFLALPEVKALQGAGLGAKIGNMALTGGYQGAIAGAGESIKNNGFNKDIIPSALTGGATGGLMGAGAATLFRGTSKTINDPQFQEGLSKSLEILTSVPSEYSERALQKELAGQSILTGKFDPKTAYRPIEEKLTAAKNTLNERNSEIKNQYKNLGKEIENKYYAETKPQSWYDEQYKTLGDKATKKYEQNLKPETYFDANYKKISDKALKSLEEEEIKRSQAVNETLNNLPENAQFKAADLRNDIQNITDSYSLSNNPDINYGLNAAQGKINQIEDLLYGNGKQRFNEFSESIKNLEFPKSYLETLKGRYKNTYHTKVLDNLNNDIVFAQRNFNANILDKLRKNPEILQNPQEIEKLEQEVAKYAHYPYEELNEQFYNKFYDAIEKGQILQRGQNFVTPKELVDINRNISKNMVNWDKAGENTANGVLEQISGKYSDRLNKLSPELASANNGYANLMDAEKAVGGIDPRTFASKLSNYKSGGQIKSGMDTALNDLNNLLPADKQFLNDVNNLQKEYFTQNYLQDNINKGALRNITNFDNLPLNEQNILNSIAKDEINAYKNLSLQQGIENDLLTNIKNSFDDISKYERMPLNQQTVLENFAPNQLNQYQNLLDEQNSIKNILQTVGNQYERNPKLLANRNDLKFENALEDLQNKSNINFMDNLLDIRARDALERLAPGLGGGSGSEQGFMNNVVRPIAASTGRLATGAILGNTLGGPIGATLGLVSVSPKITARGTIRNLGRINNFVNSPLAENVIRPLYPISAMNAIDLLYNNN